VLKSTAEGFEPGAKVSLVRYRPGRKGDLFLLTGTMSRTLEWDPPMPVTETVYEYIAKAPAPKLAVVERLPYYLDYLEFPDQTIASDAYGEFANAPYEDIAALAGDFPRDRLRQWVSSDETTPTRLGLYGLMLGLCGDGSDAALMATKVFQPTTDFRLGIEGVMSGYLLIAGERGLDRLEQAKFVETQLRDADGKPLLDDEGQPQPVPFSETYAAMQALRFMWQYAEGVIPTARLQQSMRLLLDRPELADLVIADLARWKDWTLIDRLVAMYGAEGYDVGATKRAIIRYLVAATRDVAKEGPTGAHVELAKAGLAELRKRDPATVAETERFLELLMGPPRK
jgi:hypothetical protein